MKKGHLFFIVSLACIFLVSGSVYAADRYIVHATGGTAGTYFPLGGGMAELMNKNMKGIKATAEVTGASLENCRLVEKNDAQFAQANASAVYLAYRGEKPFKKPFKKLG